jgi:hypothetical protein
MTLTPHASTPARQHASKLAVLAGALLAAGVLAACGTDQREEAISTYLQAAPDCGQGAARDGYQVLVDPMNRSEEEFVAFVIQDERRSGCTPQQLPDFELALLEERGDTARYDVRFSESVDDLYFFDSEFDRCFERLYDTDGLQRFQLVTVETDEGPKIDLDLSRAPECA